MIDVIDGQRVADGSPISEADAPQPTSSLPGHLQDLTDRARGYV